MAALKKFLEKSKNMQRHKTKNKQTKTEKKRKKDTQINLHKTGRATK